ncbi:MAG: hypothetical protein LBP89_10110 [Helicobacteraceae bacterium]|nr:hypothetical protein [Helicobacteraceae bacterium]
MRSSKRDRLVNMTYLAISKKLAVEEEMTAPKSFVRPTGDDYNALLSFIESETNEAIPTIATIIRDLERYKSENVPSVSGTDTHLKDVIGTKFASLKYKVGLFKHTANVTLEILDIYQNFAADH